MSAVRAAGQYGSERTASFASTATSASPKTSVLTKTTCRLLLVPAGGTQAGLIITCRFSRVISRFWAGGCGNQRPPTWPNSGRRWTTTLHELKQIIDADEFRAYFPERAGEVMKTSPKGYAADHPEIELLASERAIFHASLHRQRSNECRFCRRRLSGVVRILKPYCDFLNYIFFRREGGIKKTPDGWPLPININCAGYLNKRSCSSREGHSPSAQIQYLR